MRNTHIQITNKALVSQSGHKSGRERDGIPSLHETGCTTHTCHLEFSPYRTGERRSGLVAADTLSWYSGAVGWDNARNLVLSHRRPHGGISPQSGADLYVVKLERSGV